ncbi:MAG: Phosphopantetheine adenylyltransferase CAB4 [Candidatus Methanohalarchaeum thermophilum]|uniref:Phosphopantetheine adenylyltransferase n=1 Tax=Methanohalarchaeum thermophilum TaxID=1903181 RepID=A0A1Q6DVZ4_METT1|nr:MAG: Phosphopantetheine adenylyltransferase CAB4 [Candidatus Methanohalarchaeum thermophilum]
MKVAVGGTFSPIHDGHIRLLKTALSKGTHIVIGLTSDKMASDKKGKIENFEKRKNKLKSKLEEIKTNTKWDIVKINSPIGVTLDERFDAIVVTPETIHNAEKINKKRKENGLEELKIIKVDLVLAEDGKPISSTRIRQNEIDKHGNLVKKERRP